MAYTYTLAGVFITPAGGTNGASIDAWVASRFGSIPAEGAAPPAGVADAGPVISGISFGGPGAWQIACPTNEQYYVRAQYSGTAYWGRYTPVTNADGIAGGQTNSTIQDTGGQVFNVLNHGAVGNGVHDDTAAVIAAVAAAYDAGGGTVFFGPVDGSTGDYLITSTINLPWNPFLETGYAPGSPPIYRSVPIRFTGTSAQRNIRGDFPSDCTQITYAPSTASVMVQGLGAGTFECDHLTIVDGSSQSNMFFNFTNTISNIHDNAFVGNETFTSCWTDLVQYGSATATTGNGSPNSYFAGYGSHLQNNTLTGMRHLAVLGAAANAITITGNDMANTCGTNLSNDAPIIMNGTESAVTGNVIQGNTFEMMGVNTGGTPQQTGYAYGIKCTSATLNTFIANGIWDLSFGGTPSTSFVSGIYFDTNSVGNTVIDGHTDAGVSSPAYVWASGNTTGNQLLRAAPEVIGTGGTITGSPPQPQLGGYFIQTATVTQTTNSSGDMTVFFPATFPNGVCAVTATCNGTNNVANAGVCWVGQVFSVTTSGFTAFIQAPVGSTANETASWSVSYTAIGF